MSAPGERGAALRGIGTIAAILAVVYLPLFLGEVAYHRDLGRWLYPARAFLWQTWRAGQSVVWNPNEGIGLPLFASPLYGLFYPTSWLPPLGSLARTISVVGLLHVVWGAAGMWLLARRFALRPAAALVAGLGWALSGYTTAAWSAGQLLPAAAWYPWCAVGGVALAARVPERGRIAGGVALAALPVALALLLGEVFQAALAALFGAVVTAAWSWRRPPARAKALLVSGAGAMLLAGALAAPLLLPLARAASDTGRSHSVPRQTSETWSLHPVRLAELVAPGVMGDPYGHYPGGPWAGDGSSDDRPLVYGVYLGASLLALALAALGDRRADAVPAGVRWSMAGLAVWALLLALGRHTPVHAVWRWAVPIFAHQRSPEKYVALMVPAAALLAAFGAEAVLAKPRRLRGPLVALGVFAVGLALASLALPVPALAAPLRRGAGHALVALGGLGGVVLVGRLRPRLAAALAVAVVALDLGMAALPLLTWTSPAVLDQPPPLASAVRVAWGDRPGRPRVFRDRAVDASTQRHLRRDVATLEAVGYASLRPSFPTAHGLSMVPGYDAGLPPTIVAVWKAGRDRAGALLRFLAVDYAVLPVTGPAPPHYPGLTYVTSGGLRGAGLYRVDHPAARAFVSDGVEVRDDDAALARVLDDDVALGRTVVFPPGGPPPRLATSIGPCAIVSHATTRLEADCLALGDAHAVFVEQFAPGWSATVDGAPAPVLRVNLVDRAVPLGAGRHRVVLSFRPPWMGAGQLLGGVAWTLLVAAALAQTWRKFRKCAVARS